MASKTFYNIMYWVPTGIVVLIIVNLAIFSVEPEKRLGITIGFLITGIILMLVIMWENYWGNKIYKR